VRLAPSAHEIRVRIIRRPRLRALAARDGEPLLCEMSAGEMVRRVGRGEDHGAVGEEKHG
jgi:hypothetical protein